MLYIRWAILNAAHRQSRTSVHKLNQNKVHRRVVDSPNLLHDTGVKVTLTDRPLRTTTAQKLAGVTTVQFASRMRCVYFRMFVSKSFTDVRETFKNAS